jgi:hypothetical protein
MHKFDKQPNYFRENEKLVSSMFQCLYFYGFKASGDIICLIITRKKPIVLRVSAGGRLNKTIKQETNCDTLNIV